METAIGTDGGAGVCSGGGEKMKKSVDELGNQCEAMDRISALPDELRQHILTHLTLKDAIRTGALARGWRDLWRSRWAHRGSVVEVHGRSRVALRRELDALVREPRPRRRLDRFSLVVDTSKKLKSSELRRFTEYAAECRVEDLHIETRKSSKLSFHLPLSSPLLARLTLRRISISGKYYKNAQPFHALEVIRLYSVTIKVSFHEIMVLCPSLVTLDLRGCHCDLERCFLHENLRSITIAECDGDTRTGLAYVPRMNSFRYSGDFLDMPYFVDHDIGLADLYVRLTHPVGEANDEWECFSFPKDLSGLNVLTICCNALRPFSSLPYIRPFAPRPSVNLHGLKELQLLMLEMEAVNLADLYVFLKVCQCPNLERLFVQLPEFKHLPMKGSIDEVREEPSEDGLDKLAMVKVTNFNWCRIEVQLVSFLLRKARSLRKLLIVSPNVTPLDWPCVPKEVDLLLKEALASGKMVFREFDDGATKPYHSEVFTKL